MNPLDRLTHELSKLPGIGEKTALRLAIHILRQPADYARALSSSLLQVVEEIRFCSECFHFSHINPCSLCADSTRNPHILCIVEESSDLLALEKTRAYKGLYHVLGGSLSPLDGIGPDQLRIAELASRIQKGATEEIILATNHDVTGEATALYISRLLKPLGLKMTKLAAGIPAGSDIEYMDSMTLSRALNARVEY